MQCLTMKEAQCSLLTLPPVTCLPISAKLCSEPGVLGNVSLYNFFWPAPFSVHRDVDAGGWLQEEKEEQVSKFEGMHLQAFVWSSCSQLFSSTAQLCWHPRGAALPCIVHPKRERALVSQVLFLMTSTIQHKAHYKINSILQWLFPTQGIQTTLPVHSTLKSPCCLNCLRSLIWATQVINPILNQKWMNKWNW